MKRVIYVLFFIVTIIGVKAQERKASLATVEKVTGVPIFLFSLPTEGYEVVGKAATGAHIVKISIDKTASLNDKTKTLVATALSRKEKGKIPELDGIIIDLDKEKIFAVKFNNGVSLSADVLRMNEVPVYIFSTPNDEYDVVAKMEADYSAYASRGLLYDKIKSMVNRVVKKEEAGEVGSFDAIIINADDLSETLIKFK